MLSGPHAVRTGEWVSCLRPLSVPRMLLIGPALLVSWSSGLLFLGSLHWPVGGADLAVGGVSYVELLILYELWAGEGTPSVSQAWASNFNVGCSVWSRY